MRQTARQYVFDALDRVGDQSSVEHLQNTINTKFIGDRTDAIAQKQEELIRRTGLTSEAFWELYHNHPELLEVKWGNIVRLFDKTVEKCSRISDGIEYKQVVKHRGEWRKQKKIERDCRTYVGQPKRNMIRKTV